MPIEVEVPGIGVVEFPDGMPDEQIAQAIKSNFPQQAAPERSLLSKVVGALPAMQVAGGVARIAAKQMGYPLVPPSGAEPAPLGERMTRAFSTGMGGATEALGGSAEMMGMPSIGQSMQEAGRSIQKPTRRIEDVDWGSGLDVLSFAGESVLEQTPNLAIMATAILGGSTVAGSLGAGAVATAGAAQAAAATAGFLLEAGDTYTNLRALGVEPEKAALSANIAGAGKALLEAAVPVMVGKSLKWIPTEAAMKRPTLWKEIMKGGTVSAGTEAAQEVVDIEAEVLNNVNDQSAGANLMRIANAGAKGLFGEGPFTTLAAVQEVRNYEPPPELQDYAPPPDGPSTPRTEVEGPSLPDPKLSEADLPKAVAERLQAKTIEELTKSMRPWELRKALGYGADTPIGALRAAGIIDKVPGGYVFTKAVLEEVALRQESVKTEVENFLDTLPEEVQDAPMPAPPAPTGSFEGMTFETENELPAADPEYITSFDVAETVMDTAAQGVYFQLTGIVENPASTPEQVQFAKDSLRTVHEKIAKLTPGARLTFRGEDKKFAIRPRPALGFYSAVAKAIEGVKMPERATGAQYMATLKSQPGITPGELSWLGLDELEPGRVYTKQELRDLVEQNGVELQEVILPQEGLPTQYGGTYNGRRLITPGQYTDYKETILVDKNLPREYQAPHFQEEDDIFNIIAFLRTTVRQVNGKKTLLVEEMQSDLAAAMRRWGVQGKKRSTTEDPLQVEARSLFDQVVLFDNPSDVNPQFVSRMAAFVDALYKRGQISATNRNFIASWTATEGTPYPLSTVRTILANVARADTTPPLSPFYRPQDWIRLTFRKALQLAVEAGAEAIAITPGAEHQRRYPGDPREKLVNLYDKTVPTEVAALVRKFGGNVEKVEFDTGEKRVINIPQADRPVIERELQAAQREVSARTEGWYSTFTRLAARLFKYNVITAGQLWAAQNFMPFQMESSYTARTLMTDFQRQYEQMLESERDIVYTLTYIPITPQMRETVQRGQPLFKVERGRTTPASPITLADVQRVAQGQQVEQLDGGFRVRLANGKVIIIAFTGEIEVDAETVAADYGPDAPVGPAIASYEPIPFGGLIQLTNYADLGALRHEWFHSAMAMALTEPERARVLGTYKSEEVAAEAYAAWAGRGEAPHSLFKKIQKFFRDLLDRLLGRTSAEVRAGVEQEIFSRIESGEVWTAHGDFPAWEQDEIMARRALAKFAWIPPSDATALSPEQEAVAEDFKRLFKLAPKEQRNLIQKDVGRWFRGARHLMMVHQLRDVFKNYAPLERMIKQIEQYWQTKNEVLMPAHRLIEHMWMKLSNKDLALHGKLTIHVGNLSYKEKRRLGKHEVIAEAKKLGAAGRDILDLYFAVDAEYRNALGRLFKAVEAQLVRSSPDPILTAIGRRRLAKEFASLMERNYFPATRFGRFGVRVTATKGFTDASGKKWRKNSRVYFGTEDSAKGQEQLLAKVTKEYAAYPVRVGTSYIHDTEHSLIGLPPMLQDMLIGNLNLTEQQQIELHELTYVLAPSHSYVKHMMQRANTPGFSTDLMRVFANYFQHLSNHIARIETRAGMDEALLAVKQDADTATAGRSYGLLYESLAKTMSYLYNPGNEMSMLRGGLFLYYFAFMPVQAVVNLTQLPLMTYPYLAKKYGDRAALSIAGNIARVRDLINGKNLDPEMQAALEYGKSTGILTEYLAAEVASVADGGLFSGRRSPQWEHKIRKAAEFSAKPFKVSESINRHVTFMSAYELARKTGASVEAAQEEAKIATQITQGEYARWNRMPVARGRMGAVLIFKSYAQLLTYFAITNKGGWRFWFMLVAMAGLKGVPGAEDIWEIINLLGTKFKEALGLKDPKVDAERELRKFAAEIGMNPDLLMNGVSKYGFGLQAMEWLFGIPMPALDFSTKMQMGKLVPGLSTTAKALQGQMDSKTYMAQVFTEMLGAGANVWGGFTRSIIEPKTDGSLLKAVALNGAPSAVKNVMRAVDIGINGGYRDARGNLLVPYNLSNPAHLAEIVGQAAGVASNRVTKERESYGLSKERVQYIQTRREVLLGAFAGARDAEDLAEARDAVKAYNASVDPRERITVDQLYASRQARQRARALRERGFPTTLRYRYLFEEDRKLFLTPFEKEAREIPQR